MLPPVRTVSAKSQTSKTCWSETSSASTRSQSIHQILIICRLKEPSVNRWNNSWWTMGTLTPRLCMSLKSNSRVRSSLISDQLMIYAHHWMPQSPAAPPSSQIRDPNVTRVTKLLIHWCITCVRAHNRRKLENKRLWKRTNLRAHPSSSCPQSAVTQVLASTISRLSIVPFPTWQTSADSRSSQLIKPTEGSSLTAAILRASPISAARTFYHSRTARRTWRASSWRRDLDMIWACLVFRTSLHPSVIIS